MSSSSSILDGVRASTARVLEEATHVSIDEEALEKEILERPGLYTQDNCPPLWAPADGYHFSSDDDDATAQYVLVLDALNFCFWPLERYEYAQLAGSLKQALILDPRAFDAANLASVTDAQVSLWLQPPASFPMPGHDPATQVDIPLLATRGRLLRELGRALLDRFDGKASTMIASAKGSATKLVETVVECLPGFRDHAVYKGDQVFFYKRAQIFVADVFLCFKAKGLGHFDDIATLTCFADYRLPQLLYHIGILKFSKELEAKVLAKDTLLAGSEEELEIRAATVQCVERMRAMVSARTGKPLLSLELDNILWERGEAQLAQLPPHHRTLGPYY